MNHFEKQVLQGRGAEATHTMLSTATPCKALEAGPGFPPPLHWGLSPTNWVPGVTQVEEQGAILGLVAVGGALHEVKEGCFDVSSDALHRLLTQPQVGKLLTAVGTMAGLRSHDDHGYPGPRGDM